MYNFKIKIFKTLQHNLILWKHLKQLYARAITTTINSQNNTQKNKMNCKKIKLVQFESLNFVTKVATYEKKLW
jgi:hypothetical protein